MIYSPILRRGPRVGILCLLAACAAISNADLKVVSKVIVTGKRGAQVVTAISFFKGSLVRIDNASVSRITDSKTNKTIFINHDKKIYAVADEKQAMKNIENSLKQQGMKIVAHIKPTGKTKMIAGRSCHEYVGDLTASGKYPPIPGANASVTFKIDEWTTVARGVSADQASMMGTISDLLHSLAGVAGMQQVTKELSKIKGIPLTTHLDGNFTISAANGAAPQKQKIIYDTEAMSATEESLPASVFQVPSGYKLEKNGPAK